MPFLAWIGKLAATPLKAMGAWLVTHIFTLIFDRVREVLEKRKSRREELKLLEAYKAAQDPDAKKKAFDELFDRLNR